MIAGLVGSIDNDMVGTDMTIGADTALHRIVEAIDATGQHRREPSAQLRGRGDGPALRLPGPDGGGGRRRRLRADPGAPAGPGWQERMCAALSAVRAAGRRDSIVLVAEGATDRDGATGHREDVRQVLEERLGEDARVTHPGSRTAGRHAQRVRPVGVLVARLRGHPVTAGRRQLQRGSHCVRHPRQPGSQAVPLMEAVTQPPARFQEVDRCRGLHRRDGQARPSSFVTMAGAVGRADRASRSDGCRGAKQDRSSSTPAAWRRA